MNSTVNNRKGFTLVELVIVIVIVGILSIISVPIYRGYVEKAIMTEGKVLINAIGKAELAYHVKNDCFLGTSGDVTKDSTLDINAEGNKYFKKFNVKVENGGIEEADAAATVSYSVSKLAKRELAYDEDNDLAYIEVYGSNNGKSWTLRAIQQSNGSLYGYGPNREIVDSEHEDHQLEVLQEFRIEEKAAR